MVAKKKINQVVKKKFFTNRRNFHILRYGEVILAYT